MSRPDAPPHPPACPGRDAAALEVALRQAFWRVLGHHPMEVMAALESAARAVGGLYRDAAAAHDGPGACGCGCGWEPDPETDLILLEAHLAASLMRAPEGGTDTHGVFDLARLPAAGRA